jgi:hypothetical protein
MLKSLALGGRRPLIQDWPVCFLSPARSGAVSVSRFWNSFSISSTLLLFGGFIAAFSAVSGVLARQTSAPASPKRLYLLAATLVVKDRYAGYPVTLYQIEDQKLNSVREVIPPGPIEGGTVAPTSISCVRVSGNAIYVMYPYYRSSTVEVIHFDNPSLADEVTFNSAHSFTDGIRTVVARAPSSNGTLLIPVDSSDPTHLSGTLTGIVAASAGSRAVPNSDAWSEYRNLQWEVVGGPSPKSSLLAMRSGDNLTLRVAGHTVVIDALPPALSPLSAGGSIDIAAADERYLLTTPMHTSQQVASGNLGDTTTIFVHDRLRDRWKAAVVEGNNPGSVRLFGSWVAAIVMSWSPTPTKNPGRDNERSDATDTLPNIQAMYSSPEGMAHFSIPGILILENLADGRKIRIETDQEDSEILWAGDDSMLYRVNDAIYEAKIVGDKLQDTTMIVQDEDVPEVHWVFWSK